MKDARSNQEWLLAQIAQDFMRHETAILDQLQDQNLIQECGFMNFQAAPPNELEAVASADDDFASLGGLLALQVVANRQRRLMYLTSGYTGSMAKLMVGGIEAENLVQRFHTDYKVFTNLQERAGQDAQLDIMLARSPFHTVACQQYVAAFSEVGWVPHPSVAALANKRTTGVLTTLPVEDMHNLQKNTGQTRGSQKFRRPQRSMAVVIARQVLHKRHSYGEVDCSSVSVQRRSLRLSHTACGKKAPPPSCDLTGIATSAAKATYFSPSPENIALPAGDLSVLRDLHTHPSARASDTFLSCFCRADHTIVFRRQGGIGEDFSWHIGLFSWPSSGFVAWPISFVTAPGSSDIYVKFSRPSKVALFSA